jgi:GH15 family glucan-1,4-alpha-glucosidase
VIELVERLVDEAVAVADVDDTGLWEFRTRLRPTRSPRCSAGWRPTGRLAGPRARAHLARRPVGRWADAYRERVLAAAYREDLGFFTQALHGEHPDASLLLLATLGFVDARDPRFVSTVKAYERLLVEDGLMLRYRHPDDFGATTSAFTICSFWWVEALAMSGDLDRAIEIVERLVAYANPVGLFSEDIEPTTGRLLGNFPQAYTHVGLVHAAITIGELLRPRRSLQGLDLVNAQCSTP